MNLRSSFAVLLVAVLSQFQIKDLHAALLSYEPFQGYVNSGLGGQTYQGSGYAAGSWTSGGGTVDASSTGLSYPGVVSTGGKSSTLASGTNSASSLLDVSNGGPFDSAGLVSGGLIGGGSTTGTLYFAFLARNASSDVPNGTEDYACLLLQGGANVLGVGNYWTAWAYSTFGLGGDQDMVFGTGGATWLDMNSSVHLFLGKIDYTAGNDSVTVWLDPNLSLGDAQPNSTRRITATGDMSFSGYTLETGSVNNNNAWEFDEVRFGTTFLSVVPEPGTMTMMLFSALVLSLFRTRRSL